MGDKPEQSDFAMECILECSSASGVARYVRGDEVECRGNAMGGDKARKAIKAAESSSTGSVVFSSGGEEGVAVVGGADKEECWVVLGGKEDDREWIREMAGYGMGGGGRGGGSLEAGG